MDLILDKDGQISIRETKVHSINTLTMRDIIPATYQEIAEYRANRAAYKKRLARNNICPHNKQFCKYTKDCILKLGEACSNFSARKKHGSYMDVCKHCRNEAIDVATGMCNNFNCIRFYGDVTTYTRKKA